MTKQPQIRALTGLRAVAALYVFLFHIQIRWPFAPNNFLAGLVGQGAVAMSIFFVLSGFLLARQYAGMSFDFRRYAINRFARIYPVYALCAMLSVAWIGIPLSGQTPGEIWRHILQIAILIASNIFLVQAWFPPFFNYWNDGGSWSISVEAFLYFMLPLMLLWMINLDRKKIFAVMGACYLATSLPGIVSNLWPESSFGVFYSMPIFRLPEFMIGVCASLAYRRADTARSSFGAAAFLCICATIYLGTVGSKFGGYTVHDWIVVPTVCAVIIALSTSRNFVARMMGSRPAVWLGEISYCIYSMQVFMIIPLIHHHDQLVRRFPIFASNAALLFAAGVILIGAAGLCHHLVERPAQKFIRRWYERQPIAIKTGGRVVDAPAITDLRA